jgi:hypothetical protein|tara:strand:- start:284 stop:424 length:141 start_codon:yes stop_codon:yes gene_type:complete
MEEATRDLYKAITSDDFASANEILTTILNDKAIDRINTILQPQEAK